MKELYDLKDMLCKELKEYGSKGELNAGTLDVVDKLAHALKNLDKVIGTYEDEEAYSSRGWPDGMGGSYRYSRNGGSYRDGNGGGSYRGGSYARGRTMPRRYSMDGGMADELRELMQDAPNDTIKRELQRVLEKVEQQ